MLGLLIGLVIGFILGEFNAKLRFFTLASGKKSRPRKTLLWGGKTFRQLSEAALKALLEGK